MRFTNLRCTLVVIALFLLFSLNSFAQSQSNLPDAPAPQANVPPPAAEVPPPAAETPKNAPLPGSTKPAAQSQPGDEPVYAPGVTPSAGVETVPKGQQAPNTPGSGSDELAYMFKVSVDFVPIPVTVKDDDGHLVQGLLQRDFAVFENGQEQKISFFSSDPFPFSAAVVIDLGMPDSAVRKIKDTLSALDGAFRPYDEISVYTFGNTVHKEQDFTNADAMMRTIKVLKQTARGENNGVPVTNGPLASGPTSTTSRQSKARRTCRPSNSRRA